MSYNLAYKDAHRGCAIQSPPAQRRISEAPEDRAACRSQPTRLNVHLAQKLVGHRNHDLRHKLEYTR